MSIRLWSAILAGLQIITAGTVLADIVGMPWAALAAVVIGAAQAATAVYTRGTSTSAATFELAEHAYNAYGTQVNWKNFQGDAMPAWFELPGSTRRAWVAAATAAIEGPPK